MSLRMDRESLVRALQATTSSTNQKEATDYLEQNMSLVGFAPLLLHIVMDEGLDCSARQAAVIYLKNAIIRNWVLDEDLKGSFELPEQDKHLIRELIVDAIVASPEAIRVQLSTAVGIIIRHDFPTNWPHLPQKVTALLQSVDGPSWLGALLVIRRLVKLYEYRRVKEKKPLIETMIILMPMLLERLVTLMPDASQESCLLQKLILKIFYGLVQFSLNLEMFAGQSLGQWLEQFRLVIERAVPDEVNTIDEDDRDRTVWWKCKKWAAAIVERIFRRYGSPGQVQLNYTEFAEDYMANFAIPMLNTCLQVLDGYRNGNYVSTRVLYSLLQYIDAAISQSRTWKVIKPHSHEIVCSILFPLLKHSDKDEELWNESPVDFVRLKYDVYDEMHNPAVAAAAVLTGIVKRKDMMQPVLQFVFNILNTPDAADSREQDGALRIIGEISIVLTKSKKYSSVVNEMIERFVIPRITHPARFIRARACWAIKQFATGRLSRAQMALIYEELVKRLADVNEEIPVKVEVGAAIQYFVEMQPKYNSLLKPHIRTAIIEVMRLVVQAEVEETANAIQVLLQDFNDDIIPVAVEVATELANIFLQLSLPENGEDHMVTVMAILSALGSVLEMVEGNQDILYHIEEQVRKVVRSVLDHQQIDFYEEVLALANSLITYSISEPMWEIFFDIHKMVVNRYENFTDITPVLHSFLTVDTDSFLARPERINAFVEIVVTMFNEDMEEADQVHAAKLLECLILECQGRINSLVPNLVQLVLVRLHQPIEDCRTLKPMLLMVLIAGLYYDTDMFVSILPQLQPHGINTLNYMASELMTIAPGLEGVHDRKMAVIGLCMMARLPAAHRPSVIVDRAQEVNEVIISLLAGLQKVMKIKAENRLANEKESDGKQSEEEIERDDALGDSEDEIDEDTLEYLEALTKQENREDRRRSDGEAFESDSIGTSYTDGWDEDSIEAYCTPLDDDEAADVFIFYKETLDALGNGDEGLLRSMTACADADKKATLDGILKICVQRMSLAKSKKVEQQGGYAFKVDAPVPDTFNFAAKQS